MDTQVQSPVFNPSGLVSDRIPDLWVELLSERIVDQLAGLVPQQRVRS
jgi:hypothetical protein